MAASNEDLPDRDEQAALWCQSLADGPLHPEAQASFDNWLADPANARAFDDATRVWRAVDAASDHPEIIQLRREALASFWRASRNRWNRGIKRRYWLGAIAASLILALVGVAVLGNRAEIYQTGTAERRVVTLEDGSKVLLDADTSIGVRMGADRRELTLTEGRAKFDVAKNALRPFTVTAGDKIVVATGTSFSVEVVGGQVHVLLYEGRVAVLDATDRRPVPQHLVDKASMDDQLLVPGKELTVQDKAAHALKGEFTAEAALERLLGGSGLMVQRSPSGVYIVRLAAAGTPLPTHVAGADAPDAVNPDIIVTGTNIRGALPTSQVVRPDLGR